MAFCLLPTFNICFYITHLTICTKCEVEIFYMFSSFLSYFNPCVWWLVRACVYVKMSLKQIAIKLRMTITKICIFHKYKHKQTHTQHINFWWLWMINNNVHSLTMNGYVGYRYIRQPKASSFTKFFFLFICLCFSCSFGMCLCVCTRFCWQKQRKTKPTKTK